LKIAVIGTGYVGLVTGTCLAEMGNNVACVDVDVKKVARLNDGIIPIYEPGLEDLVKKNHLSGRLTFTTDMKVAVENNEVMMIAVGTPPNEDGSADLQHVLAVASHIGQYMNDEKIVVTKSTVPVGTGEKVRAAVQAALDKRNSKIKFSVASNPEFLKEGAAVNDCMKPDRIVIGCDSESAKEKLGLLYNPFVLNGHKVIFMDIKSAELTKYAANAMLATKISFINEISRVAEEVGADIAAVRQGIGSDSRIGFHFIYPGIGYGGSCFPKDVKALIRTAREHNVPLKILDAVEEVNQTQRNRFISRIKKYFTNNLKGKKVAIWGLSFKPETDDIREAPSLDIIQELIEAGARIAAYDPIANHIVHEQFKNSSAFEIKEDQYEVLESADALVLCTEWRQFRSPDFERMKKLMNESVVFDGRNQFEPKQMKQLGFRYFSIGRPTL
jgi:UDPglucose 6-dehydrogenase